LSQLQRNLDFIEKFGGSVESEVSDMLDAVAFSTALDEVSSRFIDFLGRWYRKSKAYQKFLERIFSQPREAFVSFVLRTGDNEPPRVITVRHTAYDLVEMITLNRILRNEATRKELVDLLVELVKNGVVKLPDGKVYTVREYVEGVLKVDWGEFEKKLRGKIEADINAYLHEIDNTEGSRVGKHVWLREKSLRNGSSPWLFLFGQLSTMSLLLMHTKIYASRNMWILKYRYDDYRRAALKYYSYVGRFSVVVDSLMNEAYHNMKAIVGKGLGERVIDFLRRSRYDYKDIAEAAKCSFDELRNIFTKATDTIPFKMLPADVASHFTDVRLSTDFVESVAKSKIESDEEENINV